MGCGRCGLRWLALLAGPWPLYAATLGAAPPAAAPSAGRIVQRFDFEEAALAPYTMPFNFYRSIAPDRGFPRFGRMHLTDEAAHGGRFSSCSSWPAGRWPPASRPR